MKAIELTKNEREILEAIVANAKKVGDSGVEFILQDVARETGKSIRSVSATTGSLAKKGMLLTANRVQRAVCTREGNAGGACKYNLCPKVNSSKQS